MQQLNNQPQREEGVGGGRRAATATNRGGRRGQCNNLTIILNMATREMAAADRNVSGQRRCNRATAMALRGRDGETQVASEQIQRGRKRAMETRATAIKAGRRHHKWAMVQVTAMVMYRKGSSFYNSIINKDGPRMLAR
jgi:hypothetical protein